MNKTLLFVLLSLTAYGQDSSKLNFIDLNSTRSSNPQSFITFNNETFLHADNGYQGRHLWKIDKSTNQIDIVKHSLFNEYEHINEETKLFDINNSVFWYQDLLNSGGLYKLTNGQTELLKILPTEIQEIYKKNNKVYFTTGSFKFNTPYQLWETDGNTVSEIILPINNISTHINFDNSVSNYIYLTFNSNNNTSFWAYNISTKRFTQLSSIISNNTSRENILLNDKIYISEYTPQTGFELYEINGEKKSLIKDLIPGFQSGIYDKLIGAATNNEFYFIGLDKNYKVIIYKSDGTNSGTNVFYDFENNYSYNSDNTYKFITIDKGIAFTVKEGNKTDLWKIVNGTTSLLTSDNGNEIQLLEDNFVVIGTKLYQINPTSLTQILPQYQFTELNNFYFDENSIYFAASTREKGSEPYRLNKTTLQLEPIEEINYLGSSHVSDFMISANKLYFHGNHTKNKYENNSLQKLISDKEIYPSFNHYTDKFSNYITTDKGLIFTSKYDLHIINSNGEIKSLIADTQSISIDTPLSKINNTVFFLGVDSYSNGNYNKYVYKTDGSIDSTVKISNIPVEFEHEYSQGVINNHLYYIVKEDYNIAKMYKTNGEINQLVYTFPSNIINPKIIGVLQHQLILDIYNDLNYKHEVYLSDGNNLGKILPDFTTNYSSIDKVFLEDTKITAVSAGQIVQYDSEMQTSKKLYATSNEFQGINNLIKCGNLYYATRYQSDYVFYIDFNSSIENHKLGYPITPKIECYKGNAFVMRYIDNYSNYDNNDIIIDAIKGKDHQQIYFIPNDFSANKLEWKQKDFSIFDDKIFIAAENPKYGQELMYGDINQLTLDVNDITTPSSTKNNLNIYPNPASNYFSVQSKEKIEKITLYNVLGETVYSIQNNRLNDSKFILDNRIPDGVYFIEIKSKTKSESKKIIIKK
ncbi:T9SS type A sorting domain-containing protein [Faecalibacter rhinopitheci]|uniref:T9SS type A sorting domain-containing protein n=1 Tax=Faecalibacter rhinopitheci TaxID=2779678 RepID=A0A8J7FP84_9FLAO|nr:T9SS type A sorting domain-containing protein [Faecalibacter rhinopitheci]MBF0596799.1 T9SS type A sorting domain-containing protein [Faecalibacter rhinopitheci]